MGLEGLNLSDALDLPWFCQDSGIPFILRQADQLEALHLRLSHAWPPWNMYVPGLGDDRKNPSLEEHLLGHHTWTSLRALTVEGCFLWGGDLINVVERHFSTLQALDLRHLWLRSTAPQQGTWAWARWLEELQNCLRYESTQSLEVSVYQVYDWKTYPSKRYLMAATDAYSVMSKGLNAFLVHGESNPFLPSGTDSNPMYISGDLIT